jgi:hypothetical protein
MVGMCLMIIYVCLDVNVLCMYLKMKGQSLIKSKPCIFVGYGHDEFGYRCYEPIKKKLIHRWDVIFVENQTIENTDKVEKSSSSINDHLIDLDPIPTVREVTQGADIAQEQDQHEDVDIEKISIDNEVDVNNNVIIPEILILEQWEHTSLESTS